MTSCFQYTKFLQKRGSTHKDRFFSNGEEISFFKARHTILEEKKKEKKETAKLASSKESECLWKTDIKVIIQAVTNSLFIYEPKDETM